jgi:hypothetical protein
VRAALSLSLCLSFSLSLLLTPCRHEDVATALAPLLEGHPDGSLVRFTGHSSYYDQPKYTPMKRSDAATLYDMLAATYGPPTDTLYYEV